MLPKLCISLFQGSCFTDYRPLAPQALQAIEFEFRLFQSRLDYSYCYNDELNSCHLTLPMPDKPPVSPGGYPVMVWFQYNATKMAAVANDHGRPTIIISVNYQVSIFGNMASKDLSEDTHSHGREGVGN